MTGDADRVGEWTRRYGVLYLQPTCRAHRSWRRTATIWHKRRCFSPAIPGSTSSLASDVARDFYSRHQAKRRRARPNARDLRNSGIVAAFVAALANGESALEKKCQRVGSARCKRGISALPDIARHLAGREQREIGGKCRLGICRADPGLHDEGAE